MVELQELSIGCNQFTKGSSLQEISTEPNDTSYGKTIQEISITGKSTEYESKTAKSESDIILYWMNKFNPNIFTL